MRDRHHRHARLEAGQSQGQLGDDDEGRAPRSADGNGFATRFAEDFALAAADAGKSVKPITAARKEFSLADAYDVSARIAQRRQKRGEAPVGWKIGFTNRTIWDEYGVYAPIWGYVYDRTMHDLAVPLSLKPYAEPKIEPEIMFRLGAAPFRPLS